MGLSTYGKNLVLGALPEYVYLQLHTGSPGTAGTENISSKFSGRKKVKLAAASEGKRSTSEAAKWENATGAETEKYVSFWDASTAGNFIGSEALKEEKAITEKESFEVESGSASISES